MLLLLFRLLLHSVLFAVYAHETASFSPAVSSYARFVPMKSVKGMDFVPTAMMLQNMPFQLPFKYKTLYHLYLNQIMYCYKEFCVVLI